LLLGLFILLLLGLRLSHMLAFDRLQAHRRTVSPWTEIFQGVSYLSKRLPDDPQGRGMMYLIRVDLNVPGTDFHSRPYFQNESRPGAGLYHLEYPWQFVEREHLAAAVNGTFFGPVQSPPSVPGLPRTFVFYGSLAQQDGLIVMDHQAVGGRVDGTFIWLDQDRTPHMRVDRYQRIIQTLQASRFAVFNWYPLVLNGQPGRDTEPGAHTPDPKLHARTVLGVDTHKRLLYLACFEHASLLTAARELIREGVPDAIACDGGGSSCLTLGDQARHIRPGTVLGGLRPVGAIFGIRADPLP